MRVRTGALVSALVVVAAVFACARKVAEVPPVQQSGRTADVAANPMARSPEAANSVAAYQPVRGVPGSAAGFNTEAYDHIEDNRFHRVDAT